MIAYEYISVNNLDLNVNIYCIDDSHIVMNTRKTYYHTLNAFMISCLLDHLIFLFFVKNMQASHLQDIQPQRITIEINLNIHEKQLDNIPMMNHMYHNSPI